MRGFLWLLVLLAVAACGPISSQMPATLPAAPKASTSEVTATQDGSSAATPASSPASRAPEPTPSPLESSPTATVSRIVTPVVTPAVRGSAAPSPSPAALVTRGWLTYVNAAWHVAVDYPPDWRVRVEPAVVTFSSPNGATIQLAPGTDDTADSEDMPNVRCQPRSNAQGIVARVCLDTIALNVQANFALPQPGGPPLPLALRMGRRRGDQAVLDAMLASLRAAR